MPWPRFGLSIRFDCHRVGTVYLRATVRRTKRGEVVRYLQLAHNERGVPVARVIHNFGRLGQPTYIELVGDTGQVVRCVSEAVSQGLRITVRGGGHCYEDFVSANTGGLIIDMSPMSAVNAQPPKRDELDSTSLTDVSTQ